MRLKTLGSSSLGNSYIIYNDNEAIIIEAGVSFMEAKKALGFNISQISGVCVTHSHKDHSKYIKDYLRAGIPVFSSIDVFDSQDLKHYSHSFKFMEPERAYKVGNFKVVPFLVAHDVPCFGFNIYHPESGSILFLTDTFMCEYSFPNLSHIMIEANYADDILESNIINGRVPGVVRPRLLFSHFELENVKNYLRSQDLSKTLNIVLIHLSDGNSDENRFVKEIQEEFRINTVAATKRQSEPIDFNLSPY